GSRFSVSVPLIEGTVTPAAEKQRASGKNQGRPGSKTILLVEDDRRVAAAWSMLLRAEGYRVVLAESAESAASVAAELGEPPDLVVSDYHLLDGTTGVQAVDAVRRQCGAELPAFIVSGDTSKVVDDARRISNCLLLSKPVNTDELLERARKVIQSGHTDGD
ncbi:MAG: response regulator, partial [Halioglobus sp.]|nr:response regulator [Halioglobus sp.]